MTITCVPFGPNTPNTVTDVQHGDLWSSSANGLIVGSGSGDLSGTVSASGSWTMQPGTIRLAGHRINSDAAVTGTLAAASASTRFDVLCAYLNFDNSTAGFHIHQGVSGGGRPALLSDRNHVIEVALATFQVAASGAVSVVSDDRPYLTTGLTVVPSTGVIMSDSTVLFQDTGGIQCFGNGNSVWGPFATLNTRLRNGIIYVQGQVQRQGSTMPAGAKNDIGFSPAHFPTSQRNRPVFAQGGCHQLLAPGAAVPAPNFTLVAGVAIPAGTVVDLSCSYPV